MSVLDNEGRKVEFYLSGLGLAFLLSHCKDGTGLIYLYLQIRSVVQSAEGTAFLVAAHS